MPTVTARGAASVSALGGTDNPSGSGILDTDTPAGWFHLFWFASVAIILFFLWML
jgi:hypothetical protein